MASITPEVWGSFDVSRNFHKKIQWRKTYQNLKLGKEIVQCEIVRLQLEQHDSKESYHMVEELRLLKHQLVPKMSIST